MENGSADNLAAVLKELLLGIPPPMPMLTPGAAASAMGTLTPAAAVAAQGVAPTAAGVFPGTVAAGLTVAPLSPLRIVPDIINNLLVIQATAQEYEQIRQMLRDLDIVPRQVMIEAKVYEVDLTGNLSAGVTAFLQRRTADGLDGEGPDSSGLPAAGRPRWRPRWGPLSGECGSC